MDIIRSSHEFALFIENLSFLVLSSKNEELVLKDSLLCDRFRRVLRIQDGQCVMLFDDTIQVRAQFYVSRNTTKKSVVLLILESLPVTTLTPSITILIPLLKKDAFEQALYSMQVCGVSRIVPLITNRVHNNWWSDHFQKRFNKILISAAEQSKQFSFPEVVSPIQLSSYLHNRSLSFEISLYFDALGQPLLQTMNSIFQDKPSSMTLMWGPEGDCDESEKKLLDEAGFEFVSLGSTVLRAKDAVLLGLGAIRSINNS